MQQFQVNKHDFAQTRLLDVPAPVAGADEILLAVNNFSFTANNITYAVMGEQIRYWQFFPTSDVADWGIIPVWGFATVVESNSTDIEVGERLFGYFPPAELVTIKPAKVTATGLFDSAEHRADLPPGYNMYRRLRGEPASDATADRERSLLFPLYVTSFTLHDMLKDNDWFAAEQVIIGSASSKTSIGLAYALDEDDAAPSIVGLTSGRNKAAVAALGLYDSVVTYDELTQIDAAKPSVIVDMSANGEMLGRLHTHLGDNMRFCSNVGLTHWEESKPGPGFIRERSEMFFAPGHIQKRMKDWGPEGFQQKSTDFIQRTALKSRSWLQMKSIDGLSGLAEIYDDVCHGRIAPEQGTIIELT